MSDTLLHLGLDAGDVSLKVVLYNAAEKSVEKLAQLDVPVPPLNDVSAFENVLDAWLKENGIEELASVSLTVSSFRAIVKQIFVPPEVADLGEYLRWYLSTLVNEPVERYFIDFQQLSGSKDLGWTVLFIALRTEWVDAVRKGFRNKKITPQIMNVDVAALLNLIEVGDEAPQKERCIVKADVAGVSIMWIAENDLRALRGVSTIDLVGREQMDAYRILSRSIAEQVSLAASEDGLKAEKIWLCGDLSADETFFKILKGKLPEAELALLNAFPNLKMPEDETETALLPLCVGALGAALQAAEVLK